MFRKKSVSRDFKETAASLAGWKVAFSSRSPSGIKTVYTNDVGLKVTMPRIKSMRLVHFFKWMISGKRAVVYGKAVYTGRGKVAEVNFRGAFATVSIHHCGKDMDSLVDHAVLAGYDEIHALPDGVRINVHASFVFMLRKFFEKCACILKNAVLSPA